VSNQFVIKIQNTLFLMTEYEINLKNKTYIFHLKSTLKF
jgi:hypothetical protein